MTLHIQSITYDEITPELQSAWGILASEVGNDNPFYEAWALLPAMEFLGHQGIRLLLVWETAERQRLMGLFPMESSRRFRALPVPHLRLWRHDYCFVCTPLVHFSDTQGILKAVFLYIRQSKEFSRFATLNWLPENSSIARALTGLDDHGVTKAEHTRVSRAMLQLGSSDHEQYLQSLNKKKRKEWNRLWRRFQELGNVNVSVLTGSDAPDEFDRAIEEFLELENTGWKASQGTSLMGNVKSASYFRTMMATGHLANQTAILRISLDGKPVGMVTVMFSTDRRFAFTVKIATDPAYGSYSLGSQVMTQLTQWLFEKGECVQVDSCAAEDHPMINWLWPERLSLSSVYVRNGNPFASFAIKLTNAVKPRLNIPEKPIRQS